MNYIKSVVLKTIIFSLFIAIICCINIFSCINNGSSGKSENLFNESSATKMSVDSALVLAEPDIELNVGSEPERSAWQNPELVIDKFGDLSDKIIADIGSGTGYFTFPMARVAKKVLAIDIEQRYLDYIEDRKLELPIEQAEVIETRLTVADEPNLHTDEVNAVLMVNVFYYLKNRSDYMRIVNNALSENGLLVLVDFRPGDMALGPSKDKVSAEEVERILRSAGFTDIQVDQESLHYQYIISAK